MENIFKKQCRNHFLKIKVEINSFYSKKQYLTQSFTAKNVYKNFACLSGVDKLNVFHFFFSLDKKKIVYSEKLKTLDWTEPASDYFWKLCAKVKTFVSGILNLKRLISIFNVGTFKLKDQCLITQFLLLGMTTAEYLHKIEINAWSWDSQHKSSDF